MAVNPITPTEVGKHKRKIMPDGVISVWNDLLAKNFVDGKAVIFQSDVITSLMKEMNCDRVNVFEERWLDIESIYEDCGWKVEYEKPGYNESGDSRFLFSVKLFSEIRDNHER